MVRLRSWLVVSAGVGAGATAVGAAAASAGGDTVGAGSSKPERPKTTITTEMMAAMQATAVAPRTRAELRDSNVEAGAGAAATGGGDENAGGGGASRGGASGGADGDGGAVTSKRRLALGKSRDDISLSSVTTSGIVFLATLLDPFLASAR